MKFPDNHTAEKTILRLSTDLQCSLIREYTKSISLDDYFSKSLLKDIVNVAHMTLNASSCSIIIIDKGLDEAPDEVRPVQVDDLQHRYKARPLLRAMCMH